MAPPVVLLLLVVLVVVIGIGLFVAGIGPFAQRKAQQPGYSESEEGERPVEKVPSPEQQAQEKGEIFPPAR